MQEPISMLLIQIWELHQKTRPNSLLLLFWKTSDLMTVKM